MQEELISWGTWVKLYWLIHLQNMDYIPDNYSDWTAKHEENVLHSLKQEQNYVVAELINGLQVLDNQKNRQIAKGITKNV